MLFDLRLAFRSLWRAPGFAAVVIATLALAIGANTAIFSFFHAILLGPLPVRDPDRVVLAKHRSHDFADPMGVELGVLAADFRDLTAQVRSLSGLATYTLDSATLTGHGLPGLATGAVVTPNFFATLDTRAALGRAIAPADADAAHGRVAALSHRYWLSRFGGDPAIIGQTLTLNRVPFTVVGVMPPDFEFPREAQFWVTPAATVPETTIGVPSLDFGGRGHHLRTLLGRLRPGVTRAQASQELAALVDRLPNPNQARRTIHLVTFREQTVGDVRPALVALLGCVALVLLIACLNVANLLLVRATTRQRELGIRLALGSGRWRIARQLLSESLLLAFLGGATGILLSRWALTGLVRFAPADLPRLGVVQLDSAVLGFAFGLTLLTGIGCGLAALLGSRGPDLVGAIRSGGDRGSSAGGGLARRVRAALVAGEVAIALMLLVAAGLLLRSLTRMRAVPWGFQPAQVVSARVSFADPRYDTPAAQRMFYRSLLQKLSAIPGFASVGTSLDRIGQSWIRLPFTPENRPSAKTGDLPQASYHFISPDYLRTLGIPLQQGRNFTANDDENTPLVTIVDAALARRFFPDGPAVGQRLGFPWPDGIRWAEIVGVVGAVKTDGPAVASVPDLYVPFLQAPFNNFYVHVRTPLDVAAAGAALAGAVQAIDAAVPVSNLAGMDEVIRRAGDAHKFPLGLLGLFAALALLLAALGLYAVTAYAVAQRTREIGVRLALGAAPRSVVALILRQSFRPLAAGLGAGLIGAALTAFAMRQLLFSVPPLDAPTFLALPPFLAVIALFACWLPARRATQVDPAIALRSD